MINVHVWGQVLERETTPFFFSELSSLETSVGKCPKPSPTMLLGWLGWSNRLWCVAWLLFSQMLAKDISDPKSNIGPILGSPRRSFIPLTMLLILYFNPLLVERMLWAPFDQIGSTSSGTSWGVFVLCIQKGSKKCSYLEKEKGKRN